MNTAASMYLSLWWREWDRPSAARRSESTQVVMGRQVAAVGAPYVCLVPHLASCSNEFAENSMVVQGGHGCQVDRNGTWGKGPAECSSKVGYWKLAGWEGGDRNEQFLTSNKNRTCAY